jgi:hypothetical protein
MPAVSFSELPDDARVWVFAATDRLTGDRATRLLRAVDDYLATWRAHGEPLKCARDWREDRFLAIGVDQSSAGASGCSIDALFRILQDLQSGIGTSLLGGARVFYRDDAGGVRVSDRHAFGSLAATGEVQGNTPVFDTTVTTAVAWRRDFERPLRESWHRDLADFPARGASAT